MSDSSTPFVREQMELSLAGFDSVMTPDEVAEVLHVTPKCVREQCAAGKIAGVKVGRLWRIPKPALLDYLVGTAA